MTAACSAVNVSDLPRRAVAGGSVDEDGCEMNVGVVGPRVVFRFVFKRTGCIVVDGQGDAG